VSFAAGRGAGGIDLGFMMMFLSDYLDAAMARPWAWGSMDCCHFAGDWIRAATGRDPLAPYRGRYDSAAGAARLVARRGGLLTMVDVEMARCGFERTSTPEHGDIAILPMPAVPEHVAAGASLFIADGPWWLGRDFDGLTGLKMEPQAAWRVLGGLR